MSRSVVVSLVLLAALVTIGVGCVIAVRLLGARSLLAQQLSVAAGRPVTITGPVHLRPGWLPTLRLRGITVGESTEESILRRASAGRLDLQFAAWPLLRGRLELRRLRVFDAEVHLADPSGRSAAPSLGQGDTLRLALDAVRVRSLAVEWHTDDGGELLLARVERLDLRERAGRLEVGMAGAVDRVPFDLRVGYDPEQVDPAASITVRGHVAGAALSLDGRPVAGAPDGRVELGFSIRAPHLALVGSRTGYAWPRLAPVLATGRLALSRWNADVSDVDLRVGDAQSAWLKVRGFLHDLRRVRDYSLRSDFGVADVGTLKPLVRDPPDVGTVSGTLLVDDVGGRHRVEEFRLKGGRPGVLEVDIESRVGDVRGLDELEGRVAIEARDLAVLGELLSRDLPPLAPVRLSGVVTGNDGRVVTRDLRAELGRNHFTGSLEGSAGADGRPSVEGRIESPVVYLQDLGVTPRDAPAQEPPGPRDRLFSTQPLDWSALGAFDARLHAGTRQLRGADGALLAELQLDAELRAGRLSLDPVRFGWKDGHVSGSLRVDAASTPPGLRIRGDARNLRLERLLAQIDRRQAWSGELDASFDLRAHGDSPHELAASLDGWAFGVSQDGTIDTDHARILTRDLFRKLRGSRGAVSESLNCFFVDLEVSGGVASAKTLVLDVGDTVFVGEGGLDLGKETWNLRVVPHPRRPGLLSTAATVDIRGPLLHPGFSPLKRSVVTSAAAALRDNVRRYSGLRALWRKLSSPDERPESCAPLLQPAP